MTYTKIDAKVLGYLGRALSLEMNAIQQYLSVSRLTQLRGFDDLSRTFRHEAEEEMGHAERIIGRMLVLGAAPNATQLRPAVLGESLPELIASVQSLENEIVAFYQEAVSYCVHIEDFDNRVFFEQLLKEEQEHAGVMNELQQRHMLAK